MKAPIETGSHVTLHYTLTLAGGMLVDTSTDGEPLSLVIGQGAIASGLENYLLGLTEGCKRLINIPAGEVFGEVDPEAVTTLARDEFPASIEPQPGQVLEFTGPNGEEIPAVVLAVHEAGVQVDFSHPLAGHDLIFDVEILTVLPA